MSETVAICEVGPRDGLPMARTIMPTDPKIAWIAAMAAAGVREFEVGSFVSPRLRPGWTTWCSPIPWATAIRRRSGQ
jgi:hydroxymethylglutaryl-CoA lyase